MPRPLTRTARDARHAHREWPRRHGRGNTLVLVTAILVLLVIIASAFLVRSQSGRAQAAAQQKAAGRDDRIDTVASTVAQMVADALFVRPIDPDTYDAQVAANRAAGLQDATPWFGTFIARSDFPRLAPDPQAFRYGVDRLDRVSNLTLAPSQQGSPDYYVDGYNYAPYSVNPFTNWPDRYGRVHGEQNPTGNPGFGDSRWLASTEPARALIGAQRSAGFSTGGLGGRRGNLVLLPPLGPPARTGSPILSPEGLGFSHWPHLSWIATPENGFRVCWNIADLEGTAQVPGNEPGILSGAPGSELGELALGVPYEQWLPNVAPAEAEVSGVDPRGYLVLNAAEWTARVRNWFNVDSPTSHLETITGLGPGVEGLNPSEARRAYALPNFLQLGAFGSPADEFSVDPTGAPSSRNLIARTLADADGDGWTDSFWFAAPTSSDRSTRQLVAVRIADNSAMINVNVATRFDRFSTAGHTPSDVAMVSRRESYDVDVPGGAAAAARDPGVGFANARENDPEYRVSRRILDFLEPEPPAAQTANPPSRPTLPPQAVVPPLSDTPSLVYRMGGAPTPPGVDVGFAPYRWEGGWRPAPALGADSQPSLMSLLGVVTEGKLGAVGAGDLTANRLIPIFDTAGDLGFVADPGDPVAVYPGSSRYGDLFALSRPADRLTFFKAMANNGELIDPISGSRQATLTPFGADDEIELRAANGLNSAFTISRLEMAFNDSQAISDKQNVPDATENRRPAGQFLRSSRSREESARYLDPTDFRVQDSQVLPTSGTALSALTSQNLAPRSGAELLLDHRRHLTTVSGARNDLLPPRLWSVTLHGSSAGTTSSTAAPEGRVAQPYSVPAFSTLGWDLSELDGDPGPDGLPDDLDGDGVPGTPNDPIEGDPDDFLPPDHPNVMFFNPRNDDNLIPPSPGSPEVNPFGIAIRDTDGDGRITQADFERARARFLEDNRKIDLRRAVDEPRPGPNGVTLAASGTDISRAERYFSEDLQRIFRRALIADEGSLPGGDNVRLRGFSSYFGWRPEQRNSWGINSTRLLTASLAANVRTYRDGKSLRGEDYDSDGVADNPLFVDGPLHPTEEAVPVPLDHAFAQDNGDPGVFIGVEKQPFLMEVFVAFVWPVTSIETINDVVAEPPPAAPCPIPDSDALGKRYVLEPGGASRRYALPPANGGAGANSGIVSFDPERKETWPAVVFVAQLANPYNEPVKLADFRLAVNPDPGGGRQSMFFEFKPDDPAHFHGNTYGENVELGPCTVEEPRTAIVFSVPYTFPDGRPFARDAWLDYLDIGAPIDRDADGTIDRGASSDDERGFEEQPGLVDAAGNVAYRVVSRGSVPGGRDPDNLAESGSVDRVFTVDDRSLFMPARPDRTDPARARRGTLLFDATTFPYSNDVADGDGWQGLERLGDCGNIDNWKPARPPSDLEDRYLDQGDSYKPFSELPTTKSYVELQRRIQPPRGGRVDEAWVVVDRWDNELDDPNDDDGYAPAAAGGSVTPSRFDDCVFALLEGGGDVVQGGASPDPAPARLPPSIAVECQGTTRRVTRGILMRNGADMWSTWARSSRQWLFDTDLRAVRQPTASGSPPTSAVGDLRIDLTERAPRWAISRSVGTTRTGRVVNNVLLDGTGVDPKNIVGESIRGGMLFPALTTPLTAISNPDRSSSTPAVGNRWPTGDFVDGMGIQINGKVTFLPTRIPLVRVSNRWHRVYGGPSSFPDWGPAGAALTSGPTPGVPNPDPDRRICWGEKGATPDRLAGFNHLSKFVDGGNTRALTVPLRLFQRDGDFESVAEVLDVPIWGPVVRLTRQPEPAGANAVLYRTYATLPEILAQGRNARRWFPMSPSTGTLLFPSQGRLLAADPAVNRPAGSGESAAPNRYGAHPDRLNRLVLEPATEDVLAPPPPDPGGNAVTPTLIAGVRAIPAVFARGDALAEDQNGRRSPNGQGVLSPVPGGLALLDAFVLDDRGASPFDAPKRTVAPDGEIDFEERALAEDRRFRLARNFEGKLTPGLININTAPVEVLRAMPHMTRLVYDDDFPIAPTAESSPDELDVLDGSEVAGETLASRRRAFDPMAPDLGIPQLFAAGAEMAVPSSAGTGVFDPFDTGAAGSAVPQIELNDDFGLALGASASVLQPPASPRVRVAESIDLWRTRGNVDWQLAAGDAPDGSALRRPAFADMPSYFLRGEAKDRLAPDQANANSGNHLAIAPGMRATRGFDSVGELALLSKGASLAFSPQAVFSAPPPAPGVLPPSDVLRIALGIAPDVNRNGIDDRDPGERALATDPAVANDRWNRVVGWSIAMPGLDPFRASWVAPGAGLGVSSPVQAIRDLGLDPGDPLPYWVDGLPALVSTSPPPTAGVQVVTQHLPLSGRTSLDPHLLTIATDDPGTIDNELTTDVAESSEDELRGTPERITRRDLTAGDAIERNQLLRGISNIVTTRSDVFTVWVRVRTIRQDPLTGVWNGTDPEMILDDSRYLMTVDRSSVDRPGEEPRIISFVKVPK